MTLEELKVYRAKCEEVQSTIKRDCEYIKNDIQGTKYKKMRTLSELVGKVQDLFNYLPSVDELIENQPWGVADRVLVNGKTIYISFGSSLWNCNWWGYEVEWIYENCQSNKYRGLEVTRGGSVVTHFYNDNEEEKFKLWVADNADEIYEKLVELTAKMNKAYNNFLIKKNKELLDKAEELHN